VRGQFTSAGILEVAALTAILSISGIHEALHQTCLTSITNGDFWWHLRVGLGILKTHAVPHTGLYSQASTLPWMAPSWLYDLAVAAGYRMMGLRIVLVAAILFKFALALAVFLLAGGLRGRFWSATILSSVAQYILGNLQPLPLCCSVLALCIELILLMRCRRSGSVKPLYWLPCLFVVWANLDLQFVYGIIALLLFAGTCIVETRGGHDGTLWAGQITAAPLKQIGVITGASFGATLITPYGWMPYATFFSQATSAANRYFPEYQSLRFRTSQDYVLLLLIMASFLALGIRRSRDPFQIGFLIFATVLSFRAQEDVWLATLVAVAVVSNAVPETDSSQMPSSTWQCATAAVMGLVVLLVAMMSYGPRSDQGVLARIRAGFPVAAADYIREQHLPQPLFNSYPWGGFLTWYLPEYPVATDGRSDLYGADFNIQYAKMMNADAHYSTFAPLNQARTLLLEKDSLMGKALPTVTGFRVAYADDVAVVLLRQEQQQ
jgi:hypothetical protein